MWNSISKIISLIILLNNSSIAQSIFSERQTITTDFFWRTPHNICIDDLDGDGNNDILVGSYFCTIDSMKLRWYSNSEGTGSFGKVKSISIDNFIELTAIHAADLDGDTDPDILVADDADNLAWFENTDGKGKFAIQRNFNFPSRHSNCIQTNDIDHDGDLDVIGISYNREHLIFWYENLDGVATFSEMKTLFSKTEQSFAEDMAMADVDSDGDTDIMVSISESETVNIYILENLGSGNFSSENFMATAPSAYSIISADIDNDNDMDIVAAMADGLSWYENINGLASFSSAKRIAQIYYGVVFPEDLDNDGDVDLVYTNYQNKVLWFKNNGSGSFSQQTAIDPFIDNPGVICTTDFDNDGDIDVLIGAGKANPGSTGSINWYENLTNPTSIQTVHNKIPNNFNLHQNYPNPFNPQTTIKYNLNKSSNVILKIYNLAGQEFETLFNGFQAAGEHEIDWQPEGLSSGIYFYRLQAGEYSETKKLILQK